MKLTRDEILLILHALEEKHGPGYSSDEAVAKLQGKLSIMLEVARLKGEHED